MSLRIAQASRRRKNTESERVASEKASPEPEDPHAGLPTRQEILDYIASADGAAVRRDIARAFKITGADRARLRDLLKAMEAEGALERSGRSRFSRPDELPPVAPIDVMSVDEDGDLLCMPANWKGEGTAPMIRLSAAKAAKQKPAPGVGDRLLARLSPAGDDGYEADIIKAIGKGAHRFLAVFRKTRQGGRAEPVERRARNVFDIDKSDTGGAKDGDLVWIETKNARGYGPKKARVRTIEGHIDDRHAYSAIALANHNIPTEFPDAVLEEAKRARLPDLGDREDLRGMGLVTIDPVDAKDHDDAIWARADDDPENEGGFIVVVAIADVSYFVRSGSALDREAQKRGNSTYLPDRVVPMLPERLSNNLCSLRVDEDRPCLAVEMVINARGLKKRHRFMRAMMRSHAKLAYEDAQAVIDDSRKDGSVDASVVETVRSVHAAFRARLIERAKRNPLDLELPERKIVLNRNGEVRKIVLRERFDAHRIVEEFMILANVAAAETLERRKTALIYRVHDQPDPERLDSVREYLESLDYSLVKGGGVKPSNFNQLLKIAEERDQKEMVSDIILRAQRQAVYATENLGHFGLNLGRYAHFTSPIRRYADLTVHRALVLAGKLGDDGQTKAEAGALGDIAQSISDFERRSMAAEREANDRYLSAYLANHIGDEYEGRVRGVTKFGLFVMLEDSGADGFIPMRSLPGDYYRYEDGSHAVIGETTGDAYRLGQSVRVRLLEATPLTGGLRFEMLSEPEEGYKSARAKGGRGARGDRTSPGAKKKAHAARKGSPSRKKSPQKGKRKAKGGRRSR